MADNEDSKKVVSLVRGNLADIKSDNPGKTRDDVFRDTVKETLSQMQNDEEHGAPIGIVFTVIYGDDSKPGASALRHGFAGKVTPPQAVYLLEAHKLDIYTQRAESEL